MSGAKAGPLESLVSWLKAETAKCAYCGFCESVCPTLDYGPHRGYGPRGRVNVARYAVENGAFTGEALASLYSCLLCAACVTACPAGIDIPGVVRAARALAGAEALKAPREVKVEVRYLEVG